MQSNAVLEGCVGSENSHLWSSSLQTNTTGDPEGCLLQTGDEIIITTDDPEMKPLPNFELLQMQWTLYQFAALCAGAELTDSTY
jgi:hypothetical protein